MTKIPSPNSGVTPANQTKPKKASSWTFRRGIPEQKFNVNRACFPTRIHKNGRNSWTSRFAPFFGLVCRGDSWQIFATHMVMVLCENQARGGEERWPWQRFPEKSLATHMVMVLWKSCSHFREVPVFDPSRQIKDHPQPPIKTVHMA